MMNFSRFTFDIIFSQILVCNLPVMPICFLPFGALPTAQLLLFQAHAIDEVEHPAGKPSTRRGYGLRLFTSRDNTSD